MLQCMYGADAYTDTQIDVTRTTTLRIEQTYTHIDRHQRARSNTFYEYTFMTKCAPLIYVVEREQFDMHEVKVI